MADYVNHSLVRRLGEVPIFADLEERSLLRVLGASATLYWPPDTLVFREGESAEALYVIIRGSVEILEDGDPIARIDSDGSFGERALFTDDAIHTRAARTCGETELMLIRRDRFMALLESEPRLASHFESAAVRHVPATDVH